MRVDLSASPAGFPLEPGGGLQVYCLSDLKRHDMGPELAESTGHGLDAQFITRSVNVNIHRVPIVVAHATGRNRMDIASARIVRNIDLQASSSVGVDRPTFIATPNAKSFAYQFLQRRCPRPLEDDPHRQGCSDIAYRRI